MQSIATTSCGNQGPPVNCSEQEAARLAPFLPSPVPDEMPLDAVSFNR